MSGGDDDPRVALLAGRGPKQPATVAGVDLLHSRLQANLKSILPGVFAEVGHDVVPGREEVGLPRVTEWGSAEVKAAGVQPQAVVAPAPRRPDDLALLEGEGCAPAAIPAGPEPMIGTRRLLMTYFSIG